METGWTCLDLSFFISVWDPIFRVLAFLAGLGLDWTGVQAPQFSRPARAGELVC
jgi:hypothetical protein